MAQGVAGIGAGHVDHNDRLGKNLQFARDFRDLARRHVAFAARGIGHDDGDFLFGKRRRGLRVRAEHGACRQKHETDQSGFHNLFLELRVWRADARREKTCTLQTCMGPASTDIDYMIAD